MVNLTIQNPTILLKELYYTKYFVSFFMNNKEFHCFYSKMCLFNAGVRASLRRGEMYKVCNKENENNTFLFESLHSKQKDALV